MIPHCITLNLEYDMPINEREYATLSMYKSLRTKGKLIEVLGCMCRVVSINEFTHCHLLSTTFRVVIKLQQVHIVKDKS